VGRLLEKAGSMLGRAANNKPKGGGEWKKDQDGGVKHI